MLKQAMMRDVYKRAEEKVKELENQPVAAKPQMTQAEKEYSLGAVHRMTGKLDANPEATNQALGAAAVAGGMPIPGLLSTNDRQLLNSRDQYKAFVDNQNTLSRAPMAEQMRQNYEKMHAAYGTPTAYPDSFYAGSAAVPDLEEAIAKLRQQSLLDDTGY